MQSPVPRTDRPKGEGAVPAYVLGATTAGLSVIRSLGRRGVPVLSLASPPRPPGHFSRYAETVLLPDIGEGEGNWLEFLLRRAEKETGPPVLIPTGDDEVFFVARHRRRLGESFLFRVPNDEALSVAGDKSRLYRFAAEHGVPVPETRYPEGPPDEADLDPGAFGFPCLVKPAFSHLWRRRRKSEKLAVAADRADLERLYREMWRPGEPLMIQEIVPGGDDALHGYLSCWSGNSRPLARFTKRKLRQHPPRFGNGSLQISEKNETVAEQSDRLLRALSYSGLAGVEYKRDERDGSYKLLDLNPRAVSGEQLAVHSGADLPFLHYRDALGEEPEPSESFREGVGYAHLSWDTQAFFAGKRRGPIAFFRWIRSLAAVRSFAILSLSDPAPALVLLGRAARLALRRIARTPAPGRRPPSASRSP